MWGYDKVTEYIRNTAVFCNYGVLFGTQRKQNLTLTLTSSVGNNALQ